MEVLSFWYRKEFTVLFLVLLKVGTGRPKVLTDLVLRTIGVLFTFMV